MWISPGSLALAKCGTLSRPESSGPAFSGWITIPTTGRVRLGHGHGWSGRVMMGMDKARPLHLERYEWAHASEQTVWNCFYIYIFFIWFYDIFISLNMLKACANMWSLGQVSSMGRRWPCHRTQKIFTAALTVRATKRNSFHRRQGHEIICTSAVKMTTRPREFERLPTTFVDFGDSVLCRFCSQKTYRPIGF